MKRKITMLTTGLLMWYGNALAQYSCPSDPNGFVASKNIGSTGSYQLKSGFEERAAQTYKYNGSGKIQSVRVYGTHQTLYFSGVPLKVSVTNVDASGKPTTTIASTQHVWWSYPDNNNGYIQLNFPGGVSVSNDFALTVELLNAPPFGTTFNLKYTGNGEGMGQDLASLSGTSTGNNWTSAMTSFGSNGDFYIIPTMSNNNAPSFDISNECLAVNGSVNLVNTSIITTDSMFNKIGATNYAGPNFLYTWDFGDGSPLSHISNPSHSFSVGGSYTISLSTKIEGWGNLCSQTYTRQVSVGLSVAASAVSNVTCNGAANGTVLALAQFGAAPYQFNINNGPWQASASFSNLAPGAYSLNVRDQKGCTNTTTFSITQPLGIAFNNILTTNSACGLANGAFTCAASGGIGALQYKINAGAYQTSGTFNNLTAGAYLLTVKDANACTNTTNVLINANAAPVLAAPNVNHVSCFNGNDGSISLASTGGTGAVQYSINNGVTFQTGSLFTGLVAGSYTCVVKDNAGCTSFAVATITQGTALSMQLNTGSVSCFGGSNGSIQVASFGGTGTHVYSLNGVNYQSLAVFTGLYAGNYTVYVKDVTGCVKTGLASVTQPTQLANALTPIAATCNGLSTGSLTTVVSGGTPSYLYSLDGISYQTSNNFSNLPADTFLLRVKDANNCQLTTSFIITQPSLITAAVTTTNATCLSSNGSIMAMATGGSGSGYQYSMDGSTFSSNGLFNNLAAGTYFIVLRDANMCQNMVSGVITSAGGPSIGNLSAQNVSCFGGQDGAISVQNVTGGTGALLYSKNGINFQANPSFSGLMAGLYIMYVKDANGCLDTMAHTILQPNAFVVQTNVNNILCHGTAAGSVQVLASGGAGFFAYSLNNGLNYQAGSSFPNLYAGNYTVLIKDAANCIAAHSFVITEPSPILIHTASLNVTCYGANNGAINVSASGGIVPYLYSLNSLPFTTANDFDSLPGDLIYEVHVRDANNCLVTAYRFINEPSLIQVGYVQTNVSCYGGNNGALSLNLSGGIAPYTYLWSNQSEGAQISNLSAGLVSVQVTDLNGCNGQMDFTISAPASPLVVNATITNATSLSALDGAIDLTTTGGTAPYTYMWSTNETTADLIDIGVGVYLITITDNNGCSLATTFQINSTAGLETQAANTWKLYPNPANESVSLDFSGTKVESFEIFDLMGKLVWNQKVESDKVLIQLTDFNPGMYLVKTQIGTTYELQKFTVIK
jgi:hypothetical protein